MAHECSPETCAGVAEVLTCEPAPAPAAVVLGTPPAARSVVSGDYLNRNRRERMLLEPDAP
jgi:hypothetical protein